MIVALLPIEAKYVALTFAVKKATWIKLLLTKIDLLDKKSQYAEIKVLQKSKRVEQIKVNLTKQDKKISSIKGKSFLTSNTMTFSKNCLSTSPSSSLTPISLKRNNQGSIALAHNLVCHICIERINIEYNYFKNKVANRKIDSQYTLISEMIANSMIKILTYTKFHQFIKQMRMSQTTKKTRLKGLIEAKKHQNIRPKRQGQKSKAKRS